VSDATRSAANKVGEAGRDLSAKMTEWRLNASDIEADVNAGRPVVRTNSSAGTATGRVDKGNMEKTVKGKLAADSKVADLKLDVNANAKGEVELEGKARSAEEIAAAMACALDTEGVTQVTSKIKIDPKAGSRR
jgi:osmotically-inducible protein OsmY